MSACDLRAEERAARARQRQLERMRQAAQRTLDRDAGRRRAEVIREVLRLPLGRGCRCGLRPTMTVAELQALGGGCTDRPGGHRYVCPALDAIRRRLSL